MRSSYRRAFTLIELLIVVAVIAILSIVVFLVLNPAELLRQSRDSNRISDLNTLKTALSLYQVQGGSSFGNVSTSYVSLADFLATSSAGDQCQGLSLPALPSGWTYHCAASSTFKNVDSTGWIPINFTSVSITPALARLPIDPLSNASSGNYFTYTTSGATFELTAPLESQKYAAVQSADGGRYSDTFETGSNLALAPADYAGGSGGGSSSSTHNGYTFARSITMSGSAVSGTLSSFPVLFSGTYSYLAASSSAGNVQNSNGYDIIFASDSGCSSKLNFEQESYTSSNGTIADWVDVPTLSGGSVIYLCYGDAAITTSQQNAVGTWDGNYAGVWHLNDNAANTVVKDSTSNGNNGTNVQNTSNVSVGGLFGTALSYNGSTDYTGLGGASAFSLTNNFTISIWVNANVADFGTFTTIGAMSKINSGGGAQGYGLITNSTKWEFYGSGGYLNSGQSGSGAWHYLTASVNGGVRSIYFDGALQATDSDSVGTNATQLVLGSFYANLPSGSGYNYAGNLQEARISTIVRSSQWILTEYNNQSSPSTFYAVGSAM